MHPYVHCSIIHSGQDMQTTKMCLNRLDKEEMVHTYHRTLLSGRKGKIPPFATTCVDPENIMLSEINQSGKKLRTIRFHSYVGYKTETLRYRQQYGGYQTEGRRG